MSRISASRISARSIFVATLSLFTVAAALSTGAVRAASDVTEDQILQALTPAKKPLTRSLPMGAPAQADPAATEAEGKFVQSLRKRATHSLSAVEREQIATIVKDKPKIDLEINFDYNSGRISDVAGSDTYNQDLSERRADSVKRYLVDKSGISATDLVTVGYGKTKLKDPANPMAEVNRRVQLVNTENKATASK